MEREGSICGAARSTWRVYCGAGPTHLNLMLQVLTVVTSAPNKGRNSHSQGKNTLTKYARDTHPLTCLF